MTDQIGYFKGKQISEMTRGELLDCMRWSSKEIERLSKIELETEDYRIRNEILAN